MTRSSGVLHYMLAAYTQKVACEDQGSASRSTIEARPRSRMYIDTS